MDPNFVTSRFSRRAMQYRCRMLIAFVVMGAPIAAFAEDSKVRSRKTYEFPKDASAEVIVLQYAGGFTPPRKNNEPDLTILADGVVILGAPFGSKKRLKTKIPHEQLQELLRFILGEQEFAKFDTKQVQALVNKQGKLIAVADASTTVVRVHADGMKLEGKYYALNMMARQFPKIKPLAQFSAVQRRLERLRAEIYAGGKKGIAKHLEVANKQLAAKHADIPKLIAADLQSAWQFANGKIYVSFHRTEKLKDERTRLTSVNINYPANGKPKVTVRLNVIVKN